MYKLKYAVGRYVFCILVFVVWPNYPYAQTGAMKEDVKESYIFVLRKSVNEHNTIDLSKRLSSKVGKQPIYMFSKTINGFVIDGNEIMAKLLLKNNPEIDYFEKNAIVSVAGWTVSGKGNRPPGREIEPPQVTPYGISRVGGGLDGRGRNIWIIDTGVDLDHPDLNVGSGTNVLNPARGRKKHSPQDDSGHGTHVAGIIAAKDNEIGVVGVAAGSTIHPVKVLDAEGNGTIATVLAGIDYVAQNAQPGDVVNMSLTAQGHYESLHNAMISLANQGVAIAVAAGNYSIDSNGFEPAHIEHPNIFTVSAINTTDEFSAFSNWGNPPIDYAAPGEEIISTRLGGGVITYSGTSMAAPHVAGLLLFRIPSADGNALKDPDGNNDPIAHY